VADARALLAALVEAGDGLWEEHPTEWMVAADAARAFLAQPATPVGALDVERLARAIERTAMDDPDNEWNEGEFTDWANEYAIDLAAAYLAAASESAAGGEG
jgi:hypothetical protein